MSIFTKHLRDVNEPYLRHAKHALYFAAHMLYASVALVFHAIFPFIFTVIGSNVVIKLFNIISARRKLAERTKDSKIAVIGFGASGIITLYNLVQNHNLGTIIDIYDKDFLSLGVAYDTSNMQHLLNVRASGMSAVNGNSGHFVEWLGQNNFKYSADDFVPRAIYGLYLKDLVRQAKDIAVQKGVKINFFHLEIQNISQISQYFCLNNDIYYKCYLCIGVQFRGVKQNYWHLSKMYLKDYISGKQTIHILGAGLSSFDAIIELILLGFEGNFVLHSRRGQLPKVHNIYEKENIVINPKTFTIRQFILICRKAENWRSVFDAIRPHSNHIWQSLTLSQKKSIIQHILPYWNTHRHRVPNETYLKITSLIEQEKITISRQKAPQTALDCTGFDFNSTTSLDESLVKNRIATFDELKMGLISLHKNFIIIGGKNFGNLFETTAIPEIKSQASSGACFEVGKSPV